MFKTEGRRRSWRWARTAIPVAAAAALVAGGLVVIAPNAQAAVPFPIEPLNGAGNNAANPTWGQAGAVYDRVAPANYADGRSQPVAGPNTRAVSNRIFNDANQNVFSVERVSQWGWTWGQFIDHTIGLAQGGGASANIPFNSSDPMETFTDTLGVVPFTRDLPAPGTGTTNARQAVNTENSYIDAEAVYSSDPARLDWLRDGSLDGNPANNNATLMLPGGFLPTKSARGNASTAPTMATDGRLLANPNNARVAGDVRANENVALTATQTLFAREHNRIVGLLPNTLSQEDKFQIARRIVVAEQQYITYNEFLPAYGVALPQYTGYKSNVNANLTTEFATVGYRAHSQIHGEFTTEAQPVSRYSQATLNTLTSMGVEVNITGSDVSFTIFTGVAFFNPDLLNLIGEGPLLSALNEQQYRNDETIDNQLRSTLFQVPVSGNPNCLDGPTMPQCFSGVTDLGAIDIERGRDHGLPTYNQLRQAYGLPAKTTFASITGEATDSFPSDPTLTPGNEVNDPNSIDVRTAADINGNPVAVGLADGTTSVVRRTTVAARLRATYNNNIGSVDAFTGMLAEPHLPNSDLGELQTAIWARQFTALRDGDRFFYGNDQGLSTIKSLYGIDYRKTLGQLIALDTDTPAADVHANVFLVADDDLPAATCQVAYQITTEWPGNMQAALTITNLSATPTTSWSLQYKFPNGQSITSLWNGNASQNGSTVTVANASWNAVIPAGGSLAGVGFNATQDNFTDSIPPNFSLNGHRCAVG
jgi:hypothetical protein